MLWYAMRFEQNHRRTHMSFNHSKVFTANLQCEHFFFKIKKIKNLVKIFFYARLWYDCHFFTIIYEIACYDVKFQCYEMIFQWYVKRVQCYGMIWCMLLNICLNWLYNYYSVAQPIPFFVYDIRHAYFVWLIFYGILILDCKLQN